VTAGFDAVVDCQLPQSPAKRRWGRSTAPAPVRAPRPGGRGFRGRGRGTADFLSPPEEYRGTTVQVCGLWPFSAGTGSPMVGVPLGRNMISGATLCCDPVSWFQRANLIGNPSEFVLGLPGLGKSSLVRRQALGLLGYGTLPLVLGDLKPDYVDLIRAVGGQVLPLGPGRGSINVLDPGEATSAAKRLSGKARTEVLADAHARRTTMVAALLTILRSSPPTDREEAIVDRALSVLDERLTDRVPVLPDLLQVIREAPDAVRAVAIDRGDRHRYDDLTEDLEASLVTLCTGGRLGTMFAQPTTMPMRRDRPVVFDVSAIDDGQTDLQAAALLACWSNGFGTANVANALADAHLEPRRLYFIVLDELWRALRAGRGMVDRVDALTRLNRNKGVGQAMVSHTMSDLAALPTEEDRMKAKGFVERAGMVIAGGLPAAEMPLLRSAVRVSRAEETMLASWTDPPAWDPDTLTETAPPGQGKFLIKVGGRPGIPVQVRLSEVERSLHDTNKLWHSVSRIGQVSDLPPVDDELAVDRLTNPAAGPAAGELVDPAATTA